MAAAASPALTPEPTPPARRSFRSAMLAAKVARCGIGDLAWAACAATLLSAAPGAPMAASAGAAEASASGTARDGDCCSSTAARSDRASMTRAASRESASSPQRYAESSTGTAPLHRRPSWCVGLAASSSSRRRSGGASARGPRCSRAKRSCSPPAARAAMRKRRCGRACCCRSWMAQLYSSGHPATNDEHRCRTGRAHPSARVRHPGCSHASRPAQPALPGRAALKKQRAPRRQLRPC